ncbi:MAG: VOC family protein [Chthoniobacteraceae bacterium]
MNTPRTLPSGFHTITPMLAYKSAAAAIEFYIDAFEAEEVMRLTDPQGRVVHAELRLGDSLLMLADEDPQYNATPESVGKSTVIVNLYSDDVDALVTRATAAGATVAIPVKDQFYGDRSGRLIDPFGYIWIVATRIEDVSPEEMQRRFDAMMAGT